MVERARKDQTLFRLFPDFSKKYSWEKSDKVGSGAFGTVYKAKMKTGDKITILAVKKYHKKISEENSETHDVKSMI